MLEIGQVIDRYTVESVLGQGGMAIVFRVRHNQLGSPHAVKLLTISSKSVTERLLQEGRVQASLRHPHIVAVTDVLDIEGKPGLVMEFIEGPSLDQWLGENRPDLQLAETLFRSVVSGVGYAHSKGVIHRDLKPANVMLHAVGGLLVPKVMDFGLAKAVLDGDDSGMHATRSGMTMGTPAYMAPEQIRNAKNVDQRADMFSLGCILYEMVTGRLAFTGPDILSIFNAVASAQYVAPRSIHPDLPDHIVAAIIGCLQVDRDHRIGDCETLLAVLDGKPLPKAVQDAVSLTAMQQTWLEAPGDQPPPPAKSPSLAKTFSAGGKASPRSTPPVAAPKSFMTSSISGGKAVVALGVGGFGVTALGAGVMALGLFAIAGWYAWGAWEAQALVNGWAASTGGAVQVASVGFSGKTATLDDVSLRSADGRECAFADEIRVIGGARTVGNRHLDADRVEIEGLRLIFRHEGGRWVGPEGLWSAIESARGRVEVDAVSIGSGTVVFEGEQPVTLRFSGLDLGHLDYSATDDRLVSGLTFSWRDPELFGAEPIAIARSVTLDEQGIVRVAGLSAWVRNKDQGLLDVPGAFGPLVATWLGGSRPAPSSEPWLGWSLEGTPVRELIVEGGTLGLVDRTWGPRSHTSTVVVQQAHVGPRLDDRLPFSLVGQIDGGRLTLDGDLERDGMARGTLQARVVPVGDLGTWMAPVLEREHLAVKSGSLDARLDFVWKGSALASVLELRADDVQFSPTGTLGSSARRLVEVRDDLESEADLSGDLTAPGTTPLRDGLAEALDLLLPGVRASSALNATKSSPKVRWMPEREAPAPKAPTPGPVAPVPAPAPAPVEPTPAEPVPDVPVVEPAPDPDTEPEAPEKRRGARGDLGRDVRDALDKLRLPTLGGGRGR